MIRGILLDFYGTVADEDDDIIRSIAELIASDARDRSASDIGEMWGREFAAGIAAAVGCAFAPQRQVVVAALGRVLDAVGSRRDPERLCAAQFEYWRTAPLRAGSAEFLELCPVPICVVSNIDRADLEAVIDHHGLTLPHRITSEDVQSYKPAARIFTAALDRLGLAPDEVLHIGDSLTSDVAGANAAGIPVVWVDRHGREVPEGARVVARVTDLREVLPLVSGF